MKYLAIIVVLLGLAFAVTSRDSSFAIVAFIASLLVGFLLWKLKKFLPEAHSISTLFLPENNTAFAQGAPTGQQGEVLISYQTYSKLRSRLLFSLTTIIVLTLTTYIGLRILPVPTAVLLAPVLGITFLVIGFSLVSLTRMLPSGKKWETVRGLLATDPRVAFAKYAPTENGGALKVGYTTYKRLYKAASATLLILIIAVMIGVGREAYLARKIAQQNFASTNDQLQKVANMLISGQGDLREELKKLAAQSLQPAPTVDENSLTQRILNSVTENLPAPPEQIIREQTETKVIERTTVSENTLEAIQLEGNGKFVVKNNRGVTFVTFGEDSNITFESNSLFNIKGRWYIDNAEVLASAEQLNKTIRLANTFAGSEGSREIGIRSANFSNFTASRDDLEAALDAIDDAFGATSPVSGDYVVLSSNPSLTSERVLTAGTGIVLTDGGANSTATISLGEFTVGTTDTNATAGSVLFAGTNGVIQQDNTNFFWDDTNNRLGIGTNAPNNSFQVQGLINFNDVFANTALGSHALSSFTSGFINTAVGFDALKNLTSGTWNDAFGYQSQDGANGDHNVSFGNQSLRSNTGSHNVAIGSNALANNGAGSRNVAVGKGAAGNSSGSDNIFIGYAVSSGSGVTGSNNIIIGASINLPTASASNQLNIGNIIYGTSVDGTASTVSTGNIGIGIAAPNEQLEITKNFRLPATTASVGIIKQGSSTYIHSFGTNNFYAGVGAGNLTLTGNTNTAVGSSAGAALTSASSNSLFGYQAGTALTTGGNNTYIGYQSGLSQTSAIGNTFLGYQAGAAGTTHSNHVYAGYRAGRFMIATSNTGIGYESLLGNSDGTSSTGSNNTALGFRSGLVMTTGAGNTVLGYQAGDSITTGGSNVVIGINADVGAAINTAIAIGSSASVTGTAGSPIAIGTLAAAAQNYDISIGEQAGRFGTGGANVAIGFASLFGVNGSTTGENTIAIGFGTGQRITTASNGIYIGYLSGTNITTGSGSTLLGYQAGDTLITGANNTLIGINSDVSTSSISGTIAIGANATATAANQFVAGGASFPASNVYFGNGVTNASPSGYVINGTGGTGSNIAGGSVTIAGGLGTGSGAGGSVIIQTAPAGSSGSTAGTLVERLAINSAGTAVFNETGADADFRIEGDTEANLFFLDASTDRIGIGTSSPSVLLDMSKSVASAAALAIFANTESTVAASHAAIILQSGGVNAGDPKVRFEIPSGSSWAIGVDNSDSDKFKISNNGSLGTSDLLTIGTNGNVGLTNTFAANARLTIQPTADGTAMNIVDAGSLRTLKFSTLLIDGATSGNSIVADSATPLQFGTANTSRLIIDGSGNIGFNTTTFGTSAAKVLAIGNGTAPSTSPADSIQLYAEDVAASSELKVRDEAGNITTLSPHNFTLFDAETHSDVQIPWSFYSRNDNYHQEINVDMYGAVETLQALTGKQFIFAKNTENNEDINTFANIEALPKTLDDLLPTSTAFKDLDLKLLQLTERVAKLEQEEPQVLGATTDTTAEPTDTFLTNITFNKDVFILGTLIADSIEVAQALTVHGDTTLLGNLIIEGNLTLSSKQAGSFDLPAGSKTAKVTFEKPFSAQTEDIIVSVTLENSFGNYTVVNKTKGGFTVKFQEPTSDDLIVSWTATIVQHGSAEKVEITKEEVQKEKQEASQSEESSKGSSEQETVTKEKDITPPATPEEEQITPSTVSTSENTQETPAKEGV